MKKHNDLQTNLETMSEERDQYKTLYESSLEEGAQSEPNPSLYDELFDQLLLSNLDDSASAYEGAVRVTSLPHRLETISRRR